MVGVTNTHCNIIYIPEYQLVMKACELFFIYFGYFHE